MSFVALAALAMPAAAQDKPAPAPEPQAEIDDSQDDAMVALRHEIERQQAELAAQQEALAKAQAELAAQQAAVEDLQQQVADTKLALIPPDTVKVEFEGHYRVRGHLYNHLFASQEGPGGSYQDARYLNQRLWLRPRFEYKNLAKLYVEFRALEDVHFGDNANLASTPLFAGDPSNTDHEGQEIPSVTVGRAWVEATVPIGQIRAGRIPSQWGMGILVGPGDGFDNDFGEAYYPTTNDRVLFATRPIAIFDKVTGRSDRGIPLVLAVAVDRLVEDPLFQYYGYTCDPGVAQGTDGYDRRCDSDGDGVTDLDHSYVDDTVVSQSRGPDWWADQNDDVMQMVYVLAYRGEGVNYLGGTGDLTAGAWVVNRMQDETDSNVLILDGYLKSFVHRVWLEGELVSITGDTRALPLPDSTQKDPLAKRANILGYAAKAGYVEDAWKLIVETGFASGDDNVADKDFTGRAFHPDHNVGLLLYEDVLAQTTAAIRTTGARALWSNGAVYSSRYVNPVLHLMPLPNWEILGGFLGVWPHAPDGAVIRCKSSDPDGCDTPATLQATADMIGWEVDAAIKHRWHEHLLFSLESGVAHATDRLPLETAGLNPEGNFFTVQSRLAWQF